MDDTFSCETVLMGGVSGGRSMLWAPSLDLNKVTLGFIFPYGLSFVICTHRPIF